VRAWRTVARKATPAALYWLVLSLITFLGMSAVIQIEATRTRLFLVVVVIGVAFSAACFVERLLRDYVRTAIQPNGEPSDALVQRPLKLEDVIRSLRSEVKRAGSQRAFAKKAGVNVGVVSKTLRGIVLPSEKILDALKFELSIYLNELPLCA